MIASDIYKWDQLLFEQEIEDYIVQFGYVQGNIYIRIWDKDHNFKCGCWENCYAPPWLSSSIKSNTFYEKCLIVINRIKRLKAFI